MSEGKKNELAVITMAKELAKYVVTVTQKSPKHFRFSLVAKQVKSPILYTPGRRGNLSTQDPQPAAQ